MRMSVPLPWVVGRSLLFSSLRRRLLFKFLLLLIVIILITAAHFYLPPSFYGGNFLNSRQAPSFAHFFGTDALGRDLFWRTVNGLSISMLIGTFTVLISVTVALFLGAAAALSERGDKVISFLTDLFLGMPQTVFVVLLAFALGRGLPGVIGAIAATHWCTLTRIIRAEVLQLRTQLYIKTAYQLGTSKFMLVYKHILPHLLPQLTVGAVLLFPHAVLHEAAISFLGYGLPPEQAAIGIILAESMRYLSAGLWWLALFPGLTLVLLVLMLENLAENLRLLLNPVSSRL